MAGSLKVPVAKTLAVVRDELEEDIDVTLKDSDVLIDAKVQKLWARVSAVVSSFWHRGIIQSVEYPLRLGSSAESVEVTLGLPLLSEFVLLMVVDPELSVVGLVLFVVLSLIVVVVALPAVILVVVEVCPCTGVMKQKNKQLEHQTIRVAFSSLGAVVLDGETLEMLQWREKGELRVGTSIRVFMII
ncbi:hypothetical protein F5146DRAFT_1000293 [Armillaria mellea]|nr:hypothetical protein F5146DRAFT_1000293 [Armillaria mellea]